MRAAGILGLLLCLLGWPAGARAQDAPTGDDGGGEGAEGAAGEGAEDGDQELAQAHFRTGKSYFDRGRYEDALTEFRRAFELSGRVELQYNIYLAHERLGQLPEAIAALERFVEEGGVDRPELGERLDAMRERLAERRREEAPGGTEADDAPTDRPEQGTAPVAPTPPADGGGVPTGAVVSFVAAGVGLAAFGVFGGLALAEDSSLASECGADVGATCTDDDLSTLHTLTLAADIGLGVAAVGVITGLVLVLTDGGGAEEPPGDVAIQIGPTGAVVRGAF